DILDKIKKHMDESFSVEEVSYVPTLDDSKLTFGNKGLKFNTTVLYIDLRGSTELLNKHNKSTVAKVHKAYYYTIVKISNSLGGENRSFNGDSLLVFFQGTSKATLSNAVQAAMMMTYMLSSSEGISKHLKKYTSIDFGIGMDDGDVLCTKVGIGGTYDNKDLIWIGNPVNKSTVLSDKAKSPNHIYISKYVYDNLLDYVKYHEKEDNWGNKQKVDMWTQTSIIYNGGYITCYYTSYYWTVE
ncbi:MAG: adenylate/guanylate cyclase domain-containing protein, partial [Flavobacteriales bacterium]|nr:adenylate/guanylate cyclase domain-containing protein [Flavobacteriales bacterium]